MGNIVSSDIAVVLLRIIPFLLPAVAGVVICIIDRLWDDDNKDMLIFLAVAALIGSVVLFWGQWMTGAFVSRFNLSLVIVVTILAAIFILTASSYFQSRGMSASRFVIYCLFATFGIMGALAAPNFITIFVGLVVASITLTFLLRGENEPAARRFWIYSLITDLVFCLGAVFFFGASGSFDLRSGSDLIELINKFHTGNYFRISFTVMMAALFAKMAVIPLHWWVADIARLKSLPLINFMLIFYRAAIVLVALKILVPIAGIWGAFFEIPMIVIAILTISWAGLKAFRARDMRSLVAASSTVHIGYIVALFPTIMVAGGSGVAAIVMMVVAFSVSHMGAITLLQTLPMEAADAADFSPLEGLAARRPWIAVAFGVFLMSMSCLPPFIGFISRFIMIRELAFSGNYLLLAVVAANIAFLFYCLSRPLAMIYLKKPAAISASNSEICYSLITVIAVAAMIVIYLGLLPGPFIHWIQMSVSGL